MTSKERLEEIRKQLEKTCLKDCGHGSNENCICLNNQYANLEHLEKDLERLEKQDKILERVERPMFYSERKKLGEEYIEWAKENNVNQNDLTSIVTWCFCFKMKEWLDNAKSN